MCLWNRCVALWRIIQGENIGLPFFCEAKNNYIFLSFYLKWEKFSWLFCNFYKQLYISLFLYAIGEKISCFLQTIIYFSLCFVQGENSSCNSTNNYIFLSLSINKERIPLAILQTIIYFSLSICDRRKVLLPFYAILQTIIYFSLCLSTRREIRENIHNQYRNSYCREAMIRNSIRINDWSPGSAGEVAYGTQDDSRQR